MSKLKRVVDLDAKAMIEVPSDSIRCSVCGKWKAPSHYRNEGDTDQSRTNCTACYSMDWADMQALKVKTKERMVGHDIWVLTKQLEKERDLRIYSTPVQTLIAALQKLPSNARVCMTQDGYYAEGDFADLFVSDFEKLGATADGQEVYSIGHSAQNY